jgi:hypothetical protein
MLNERRQIVADVQGPLEESEIAIEAAYAAIGKLAMLLPEARKRARISPVAGQPAFDSIVAALSGIVQVRSHIIDAHGHLDETRDAYRLPIVDTGAGYEKPSFGMEAGALALVSESKAA